MACDFVTGIVDTRDEIGESFGDPAEDEKGGVDVVSLEECEDAIGVLFDSWGDGVPLVAMNVVFEGGDLEVVFDVYGHSVC